MPEYTSVAPCHFTRLITHLSGDNVLDGYEELLGQVEGDVTQTHNGGAEVRAVEVQLFLDFLCEDKQHFGEPQTENELPNTNGFTSSSYTNLLKSAVYI